MFTFYGKTFNIKKWSKENHLGKLVSIDTETETITSPSHTPDLVTFQVYNGGDTVYFVEPSDIPTFFTTHSFTSFIFHNAPFDVDVISPFIPRPTVYRLYDKERILDTSILFRLLHLGKIGHLNTKYSLDYLVKKFLNVELPKDEEIRLKFAQYKGFPVMEIPTPFLEYAAKDAVATFYLYLHLMTEISTIDTHGTLLSHHIQVKGDLALYHIYKRGIGFDLSRKEDWLKEQDKTLFSLQERLANWGWVRGVKGVNDRFEEILKFLGIADKLPITDTGSISSKSDDLSQFRDIEFIDDYLSFNELEKATSFVRNVHHNRIHPRYTVLLTTGRTSCSGSKSGACNIQQIPKIGGLREMFIPEQGKLFVDVDYASIELAGLAQVNLKEVGYSKMADLINEGKCLHYHTAASVYDKEEKDVTKEERQFAKIPNFGFGANMSPATFTSYCKGYGVKITEERAKEVKNKWVRTYPEMKSFFNIGDKTDVFTLTGRLRANCTYTAYLNTKFQGLCADGLKLAMYRLDKEGYAIVAEIHDQILFEVDKDNADEDMKKIEVIMIEEMQKVIPDVKIATEGQILERWIK